VLEDGGDGMSDPQSITVYDPATGLPMVTFSSATASATCELYDEWARHTSMLAALEAMNDDKGKS
jgi:hypothetical protein